MEHTQKTPDGDHVWASEEEKRARLEQELDDGIDTEYLVDFEFLTGPRSLAVDIVDPLD